jgi:hypothetical protein
MAEADLSSGMPAEREQVLASPPKIPYWSENMMFALYDPTADLGFWLHLGTVPTNWEMWEDRVLAYLPGGAGVLHMWAYHRTPAERRPAGSNLSFRCVEPFRRWHLAFDGIGVVTPYEELRAGRARDGVKQPLAFDLDVQCATPAWDAHLAVGAAAGHGSMRGQSWATEHYQQLYQVTGTVRLPDREVAYDGTGWRDHSRGPRHPGAGAAFGGHAIMSCLFPSGRGIGISRFWAPDGEITLDAGYVSDGPGHLEPVSLREVPRLTDIQHSGELVVTTVRRAGSDRDLELRGTTVTSLWMTRNMNLAYGADLEGVGSILAESFARFEWDGEVGYGLCERSEHVRTAPPRLYLPAGAAAG